MIIIIILLIIIACGVAPNIMEAIFRLTWFLVKASVVLFGLVVALAFIADLT